MQTFYLDISNKGVIPTLYAKQGDVGRRFLVVITDSGLPYKIPENAVFSVWYDGDSGDGNYSSIGENSATNIDGNKVSVEIITQMVANSGNGALTLVMNDESGNQIGFWNIPYIVESVAGADSEEAKSYYTAFSESTGKVAESANKAKEAEVKTAQFAKEAELVAKSITARMTVSYSEGFIDDTTGEEIEAVGVAKSTIFPVIGKKLGIATYGNIGTQIFWYDEDKNFLADSREVLYGSYEVESAGSFARIGVTMESSEDSLVVEELSENIVVYIPTEVVKDFTVYITEEPVGVYHADKTYDEILAAINNGQNVRCRYDSYILPLAFFDKDQIAYGGATDDISVMIGQRPSGDVYVTYTSLATKEEVENIVFPEHITPPSVASVGQTIVVKSVDENGKPTSWEAKNFPSGSFEANKLTFTGAVSAEYDGSKPVEVKIPEGSDPRVFVNVTDDGDNTFSADMTFAQIKEAYSQNKMVCCNWGGYIMPLSAISVVSANFSGFSYQTHYRVVIGNYNGVEKVDVYPIQYAERDEIPTTLPNPYKLTFDGAVSGEYDGSRPVNITIPQGGGGSSKWNLVHSLVLQEETSVVNQTVDGYDEYILFIRTIPGSANTNNAPLVIDVHSGSSVERYSVDAGILNGTKAVTTQAYFCKPIGSSWVYGMLSRKGGSSNTGEYGYKHSSSNQITKFDIYTSTLNYTLGVGTEIAIYGR